MVQSSYFSLGTLPNWVGWSKCLSFPYQDHPVNHVFIRVFQRPKNSHVSTWIRRKGNRKQFTGSTALINRSIFITVSWKPFYDALGHIGYLGRIRVVSERPTTGVVPCDETRLKLIWWTAFMIERFKSIHGWKGKNRFRSVLKDLKGCLHAANA